ncbi:MAG TPA: acyltransferase family protein [Propionicimonas sp.]|uniref:acyltransferase family protein n=1 Tax=Propionicimonas sp. TaxID=1955623 RepID=UPI002F403D59
MTQATPSPAAGGTRLFFMDWLRVIATALIFAYHCARPFDDFEPWHIKYDVLTDVFTYPMGIGSQFIMPLFWILSGMGMWLAVQALATMAFLRRRLARLLVPVVTVGWFVLCPPQVYIESTTGQQYNAPPFVGTFWEFLPHYFTDGAYGFGGWFPVAGLHLWYLTYLALFTLASLPLLRYLASAVGRRVVTRLASGSDRWWVLPLLGLPLVVTEVMLPPGIPVLTWAEGGWRLGTHWMFLMLGLVLGADERLRGAVEKGRRLWLVLASASLVPLLFLAATLGNLAWGTPDFAFQWGLRTLNGWLCLLAIIGYGSRYLRRGSRALRISSELVLPFYVLHQTVIVLLAYGTRYSQLPVIVAYPLLMATAFFVCAGGCLVIRRYRLLRFLFGMSRPHPHAASGDRKSPLPATE